MNARQEFWEGCRDCLPLMVGGVAVFSGAAQFVAISMIVAGAANPGLMIIGAFLVNAHNLLLGTSLAPRMAGVVAAVLAWRYGNFVLTVSAGTAAMLTFALAKPLALFHKQVVLAGRNEARRYGILSYRNLPKKKESVDKWLS